MIIALPVEGNSLDSPVCMSFGRAPFFMFYNTGTAVPAFLVNEAAESQGGAGIKAAQILVDNMAEILLAPRCGENAAMVLHKAEIRIFKSIPGTARENIDAFEAGKLEELNEIHPGFHGHAGEIEASARSNNACPRPQ